MRKGQTQSCDFCSQIGVDITNSTVWWCLLVSILYLWWAPSSETVTDEVAGCFSKGGYSLPCSFAVWPCFVFTKTSPLSSPWIWAKLWLLCSGGMKQPWGAVEKKDKTEKQKDDLLCSSRKFIILVILLFVFCNAIVFAMTWKRKINLRNG